MCLEQPLGMREARRARLAWTATEEGDLGGDPESVVSRLGEDDLYAVFQPIVDMRTGEAFAYEALARCRHPELANPAVLFSRAASEKVCGRIGRRVREVAFGAAPDAPLFVNLHPQELISRWIVRPDDPIGFHSAAVYLEITESAALDYFDVVRAVISELRSRIQVELVVDDFGAGYSNLRRIIDLRPKLVKLDRALISGVYRDDRLQRLVRHLVMLCAELEADVVAEGIEGLEDLVCLRGLGVRFGQGYLLGRPAMPAPDVHWPLG